MDCIDKKSYLIILIAFILGTFVSFLRYPQYELLNCSRNYECFIEYKYFGIINIKKPFKITKNTLYSPTYKEHLKIRVAYKIPGSLIIDGTEYHHRYTDGKNINIEFKNYIRGENEYQLKQNEIKKFEKYKENPNETNYYIKIYLDIKDRIEYIFRISIMISIILMIIIYPIEYYKEQVG